MPNYISEPCGNYVNISGIIKSPGFPYHYNNKKECIYEVSVSDNTIIKLTIIDFDVEWEVDCQNDFLEIRDGNSDISPLLGKLCGNESNIETKIFSTGSKMWIR